MKTPWHLWVVGILAVLWNAGGAYDYVMTSTHNEAYLANFTAEQIAYYTNLPPVMHLFWAVAIWSAVAASILLLLRKAWASMLFFISFVTMMVSFVWGWFFAQAPESTMAQFIMTVFIVIIGALLLLYAAVMKRKGVLN